MYHQYYTQSDEQKQIGIAFLTLAYFVIEFLLNYTLYIQTAIISDPFAIQSLEYWGKVIAGIGLGLLITKILFIKNWQIPPAALLALICVFSIPASFHLQDKIANEMAKKASDKTLNDTALVLAVKSTIVPYYDFSNASYTINKDLSHRTMLDKLLYPIKRQDQVIGKSYVTGKQDFMLASYTCKQDSLERLGIDRKRPIDSIFWGLNALKKPITKEVESEYKSAVNLYSHCLYKNEDYRNNHSGMISVTAIKAYLDDMYQGYAANQKYYNEQLRGLSGEGLKRTRKVANERWKKEMDKRMGFSSTLKADLYRDQFLRHPDVKRKFISQLRETGYTGSDKELMKLYPYTEEFNSNMESQIAKKIDKQITPNYIDADLPLTNEFKEDNLKAYKALVMPIVGIGLSAFFLILNCILVAYNIFLNRKGPLIAVLSLMVMLFWFAFYPYMSLMNHDAMSKWGYAARWTYYHENILTKIHRVIYNEDKKIDEALKGKQTLEDK